MKKGGQVFSGAQATDSDWGGNKRDRKSTSGGAWMLRGHCIKTWSSTHGADAVSSAEAELYGMVEGVTRVGGLRAVAGELVIDGLGKGVK